MSCASCTRSLRRVTAQVSTGYRRQRSSKNTVVGSAFEDEGTRWVVHDVRYELIKDGAGCDVSGVIVLYFEEGDAEAASDEDAMEWSTFVEVAQWIKGGC